ncbi:MAG: UvrD-helicase domain-containing protein [Treponemataceae bacterium]|nr:UvrD-helicase domain-containing protein [Treponemataceae bacterium]
MNPALENLNDEQREAAQCLKNIVVAAGAGSGKTHVLSHRYTWMVTELGYTPDQILTLTFTKKAASEMYGRIYKTLKEFAETQTGLMQQRAQNAVDTFHKARIQTLDSYCNTVVKTAIHHYGISPDFTMDDTAASDLAEQTALSFVMNRLDDATMRSLIQDANPASVASGFFADAVRNHSNLATPAHFAEMTERQRKIARDMWPALAEQVTDLMKEINQVYAAGRLSEEFTSSVISTYKDIFDAHSDLLTAAAPAISDADAVLRWLDALCKLKILDPRTVSSKAHIFNKTDRNPVKLLRPLFSQLCQLFNFDVAYDQTHAISALLDDYQREFHDACRTSGVLTFADVAEFSRLILTEYKDIRQQEKNAFKAIMIDEFQDDNELQRDILYLISEDLNRSSDGIPTAEQLAPEKLFFVGDEKQSIYKFRGADVTVFNALKNELQNCKELNTNYRSKENLLKAFNSMFSPAGNPKAPLFETESLADDIEYEARYSDALIADKNREQPGDEDKKRVHIQYIHDQANPEGKLLSVHEQQARMTVATIQQLMAERGYRYSDFAILFRWTTHQKEFERVLRSNGIPYTAENVSGFFEEGVINDLYSFLRLLVYPTDTFAYGSLLKSPLVQLSAEGTLALLSYIQTHGGSLTDILPFSNAQKALLQENDLQQFEKGKRLFEDVQNRSNTASLPELVSHLWYTLGYRYETMWNSTVSVYETLYDYLFETACKHNAENKSLAEYVDYLASIKADSKEKLTDIDIPMEQRDAVHIMTIHKSKGLEFPVVFIPDLENDYDPGNRSNGWYSYTKTYGLIPMGAAVDGLCPHDAGNWFTTQNAEVEKNLAEAELRRILYVGITRAEDEVFLIGYDKDNTRGLNKNGDYGSMKSFRKLLTTNLLTFTHEKPALVTSEEAGSEEDGITRYETNDDAPFTYEQFARIPMTEETAAVTGTVVEVIGAAATRYPSLEELTERQMADQLQEPVRANPSSFGHEEYTEETSGATAEETALFDTSELNAIIEDHRKKQREHEPFAENDFGTIAHAKAEEIFTGRKVDIPKNIASKLNEKQLKQVESLAVKMAEQFVNTELGQKAKHAPLCKSEYTFKTRIVNDRGIPVIVDGQIDLLFDVPEDNTLYVVDFKTDQAMNPEKHTIQLAFYKRAAEQMFATAKTGRQVRCCLYYLRYGKTKDCTMAVDAISLESLTADGYSS